MVVPAVAKALAGRQQSPRLYKLNKKTPRFMVGGSYNGSTAVSKTACVGSIPTAPAKNLASIYESINDL